MYKADLKHKNKALQDKLESLYRLNRGKHIDLSFRPPYLKLLEAFGNPHKHLPPSVHVAGTNGKGSTIAMMRAMLEKGGYKVHVYTSPHLHKFNERIVLAGGMISDIMLEGLIDEAIELNAGREITFFEITTAMAFAVFKRVRADIVLIEVGMGGRLDCTNILAKPHVSLINRVSNDHMEYLGDSLDKIIREKAGIMKYDTPCIIGYQGDQIIENCQKMPMDIFVEESEDKKTPLICAQKDWCIEKKEDGFIFRYGDHETHYPLPNLGGGHQIENAGLALAAMQILKDQFPLPYDDVAYGLTHIKWPGRLERITHSPLCHYLNTDDDLWYDGGHNDSAGAALARQIENWQSDNPKDMHLILGMKADKNPDQFLKPIWPFLSSLTLSRVNDIGPCITKQHIEPLLKNCSVPFYGEFAHLEDAVKAIYTKSGPTRKKRILICGSLYLAEKI